MKLISEYNTKPRILLVHSPEKNQALFRLKASELKHHNYRSVPDPGRLATEFQSLIKTIKKHDIQVIEVADFLNEAGANLLNHNPNSLFVRDSLITLPWAPEIAIVPNMTLLGRQTEPHLLKAAAHKLGVKHFIDLPRSVHFEGGDITAVTQGDKRTLFVGIGGRTTASAGRWLARRLIPQYADQIVCLEHNQDLLHLDTCFSILPHQTVVCARGSLIGGFVIDSQGEQPIEPTEYLGRQGYKVVWLAPSLAASDEDCNLLYVGNQHYLSFKLPGELASALEKAGDIDIEQLDGTEIAKANGGVHCLTRPIY